MILFYDWLPFNHMKSIDPEVTERLSRYTKSATRWIKRYQQMKYWRIDPLLKMASPAMVDWNNLASDARAGLESEDLEFRNRALILASFYDESSALGMENATTIIAPVAKIGKVYLTCGDIRVDQKQGIADTLHLQFLLQSIAQRFIALDFSDVSLLKPHCDVTASEWFVLERSVVGGLSYEEIGKLRGTSANTVKVQLVNGRKKLLDTIGEEH